MNDVAQSTRSPQESSKALVSAIDQAGSKAVDDIDALVSSSDDLKHAVHGHNAGDDGSGMDIANWAEAQRRARDTEPDKSEIRVENWWMMTSDQEILFAELPAPVMILIRCMDRMSRFRVWITQDPEFANIIDTALNNRAKESSRRQVVISIIVAIVSLAAGWMLNAINPLSLLPH
jgi:hypothetical protein